MSETGVVKGFKVFNPDWTCNPNGKPFQYAVGGTYEEDVKPMVCDRGFHFCEKAADCFNYYQFNPENKVAALISSISPHTVSASPKFLAFFPSSHCRIRAA